MLWILYIQPHTDITEKGYTSFFKYVRQKIFYINRSLQEERYSLWQKRDHQAEQKRYGYIICNIMAENKRFCSTMKRPVVKLCKEADVDGVVVHAVHEGYLISFGSVYHTVFQQMHRRVRRQLRKPLPVCDGSRSIDQIGFTYLSGQSNPAECRFP